MTIRFSPGAVLKLRTSEGSTAYAVMLDTRPYLAFYREDAIDTAERKILSEPIFIVAVHKSAYSGGGWGEVVARIPRESLPAIPPVFRQNILDPADCTIDYPDGSSQKAAPADCAGLEPNAVWEAGHIESRIDDFYAGRPNRFAESMRLKLA